MTDDTVNPRDVTARAVAIVTVLVEDPRSEVALDILCEVPDIDEMGQLAMALAVFLAKMIREVPPPVRAAVLRQLGLIAATAPETA